MSLMVSVDKTKTEQDIDASPVYCPEETALHCRQKRHKHVQEVWQRNNGQFIGPQ